MKKLLEKLIELIECLSKLFEKHGLLVGYLATLIAITACMELLARMNGAN